VVEYCFRDGMPEKWAAAGARLAALARALRPGMGFRSGGVEALPAETQCGGMAALRLMREDGGQEMAGRLLEWLFQPRLGARRLRDAAARMYLLARTLRPEVLRVLDEDGGWREMTFEDFGVAFGEGRGGRARWHYRARVFLKGLPHATWQRGEETREKCRKSALGNRNRRQRKK
jgi:hypothetical protein